MLVEVLNLLNAYSSTLFQGLILIDSFSFTPYIILTKLVLLPLHFKHKNQNTDSSY